jgi:fructosamine-3-kinase
MLSQLLGDAHITGLHRLSGGASRETWRFEADGRALILQRQRTGDQRDMLVEAGVLRAALRGGVPVPHLIDARRRDDGLAFMVLEAVDGETIARKILRDDEISVRHSPGSMRSTPPPRPGWSTPIRSSTTRRPSINSANHTPCSSWYETG